MAGADIKLLFGVLGEGSLSGESGQLIQTQLTQLMAELNKNPLKVKIGIDTNTGGKRSWSGQLQEKLNQLSQSGKFSVQISNLKLSSQAVSGFKKQLSDIINTVDLSAGTNITITSDGLGELKSKLHEAQGKLEKTGVAAQSVGRKISSGISLREITETYTRMQNLLTQNPQMRGSGLFSDMTDRATVFKGVIDSCSGDTERLGDALQKANLNGAKAIESAKDAMAAFKSEISSAGALADNSGVFQRASKAAKEYYALLSKANKTAGADIVLTPDGYQSLSGSYATIADELNKAGLAFDRFTSQAARSKMSEKELADLTQILETKERDLAIAIEERTAKQRASESSGEEASLKAQINALNEMDASIQKSINGFGDGSDLDGGKDRIAEIAAQYDRWAEKIKAVSDAKAKLPKDGLATIKAEGEAIQKNIDALVGEKKGKEESVSLQKKRNAAIKAGIALLSQMQNVERSWTAARNGKSSGNYSEIRENIEQLKSYQRQLEGSKITVEEFRERLSELQRSFNANSNAIKENGENTKNWGDRLGGLAQKFSTWLGVSQIIMLGVRSIRKMITATIELDDAMTQLKIVTRDTANVYEDYLGNITKTASNIGSSVSDLVDSTTTFARLGYSIKESSALAEYTAMLQNVGDIDVSDAQDALTAIIKAFGLSVDEIESVMDKLVITGRKIARWHSNVS